MHMMKTGIYRHFKGKEYQVLGIATHTETGEECVVYRAVYEGGKLWIRPLEMFTGGVEKDGYKGPRFVWVRESA